jgi:GNAT superfamily N-acetyltransferase
MPVNANHPKRQQESVRHSVRVDHTPGIITITDANTTIGYCLYDQAGEIEYVFVNPSHRRSGYAKWMLAEVEQCLTTIRGFRLPISPLGEKLVASFNRRRGDRGESE